MSVLNQSGEEQVECPLCMEPLEVDDLNFFPCTCGYQICRFCWHRIRTDENGLCPACRKAYSEDPADFIPLSQEQVAKLKAEKRQRDQQRKAKLSESRKHLASVRVVQRNLVFVVGLPMRLAEPDVLKKHEYFGKFGKIHKVVINQSTSYAGSQGPSASAYVTYLKSDDALRAIQSVNNVTIDGRLIKSSLGTTKYCSHFMKNQSCPKPDCMYLHDFGDPEASFTKEEMHAGKHQEFEKKLHDSLLAKSTNNNQTSTSSTSTSIEKIPENDATKSVKNKEQLISSSSSLSSCSSSSSSLSSSLTSNGGELAAAAAAASSQNWPQLNSDSKKTTPKTDDEKKDDDDLDMNGKDDSILHLNNIKLKDENGSILGIDKFGLLDDNSSFFSHNTFQKIGIPSEQHHQDDDSQHMASGSSLFNDCLPDINTCEDWAAAFGFSKLDDNNSGLIQPQSQQNSLLNGANEQYYMRHLHHHSNHQQQQQANSDMKNGGSYFGKDSGLDQHMSKFFMDFHMKNNGQQSYNNGYYGVSPDHVVMMQQQRKYEEQLLNLSMNKNGYPNAGGVSLQQSLYSNGDMVNGFSSSGFHNKQQQQQQQQMSNRQPLYNNQANSLGLSINKTKINSEDELDFDPFQETQKALAEIIANEHNIYKATNNATSSVCGINKTVPPPPPGFIQPSIGGNSSGVNNTHMNSFGSKILPFLNMSNQQHQQQQQQISPNQHQNWPPHMPPQMPHAPLQKGLSSCNDWKEFDSAIVTTSRHYPLPMAPNSARNHYQSLQMQQQQNGRAGLHDFGSSQNAFSSFTQQIQQKQPNFNNFTSPQQQQQQQMAQQQQQQQQQSFNWLNSELGTQISSPPGFRNTNQTSKQQEC